MYLTGNSRLSLDSKARITLPADIRREFVDGKVCLLPVHGALWGFTPEGHKTFVESLFANGYNPRSQKDVKLKALMNGRSKTIELDGAGRLNLGKVDEATRRSLGIGPDVVVFGNDDHFEVWNAAKWDEEFGSFGDDDLDALLFGE